MQKKFWAPGLLVLIGVAVAVFAQERNKGAEVADHERLLREVHGGVSAMPKAGCSPKGSIFFGQMVSNSTSFSSCVETIPQGTVYIDFWTLNVPTGHTVRINAHSAQVYLATIQDINAGTVLASTLTCGFSQDDCSFNYQVQLGGQYAIGFATVNGVGSYTLLATDVSGGPNPTPVPTRPNVPTPTPIPQYGCYTSASQVCLNQRYTVAARWDTSDGRSGSGVPVPMSGDTGYFYFFSPSNVELVVKVLDGRAINGHVWVFYGALSDVHYVITVRDSATGAQRLYENPQGNLASVADTAAF